MNTVEAWVGSIALIIIIILGGYNKYLNHELAGYKTTVAEEQAQIASLKAQSDAEKQRFAVAQQQANQQMVQVQQKAQDILREDVSHNCEQAIEWSLQEAKKF